jgi:hypothetical protein
VILEFLCIYCVYSGAYTSQFVQIFSPVNVMAGEMGALPLADTLAPVVNTITPGKLEKRKW